MALLKVSVKNLKSRSRNITNLKIDYFLSPLTVKYVNKFYYIEIVVKSEV